MKAPTQYAGIFYQLFQQYKEAQLLAAGIRLDVFSYLAEGKTAAAVAAAAGYDLRNLALFLDSLVSIGLLRKEGQTYSNTPETATFLARQSPYYLGEYLLFRQQMTSLEHLEERVRQGPDRTVQTHNKGAEVYNFRELARLSAREVYTGRVQSFMGMVAPLFGPDAPVRILDLGGGPGILAIEFVSAFPAASGVIFEHPAVADIPAEFVAGRGLEQRLRVWQGDFTVDGIGAGYDLIIASGIMDFAGDKPQALAAKMAGALNPQGYLYLVCHNIGSDLLSPKEPIVNWLSSRLDGLEILLTKERVEAALTEAGFRKVRAVQQDGVIQKLSGEVYRLQA